MGNNWLKNTVFAVIPLLGSYSLKNQRFGQRLMYKDVIRASFKKLKTTNDL